MHTRCGYLIGVTLCAALGCGGGDDGDQPPAGAGTPGAAGMTGTTAGAGGASPAISFASDVQPKINEACNCHQSTPTLMAPFSLKPGEAYGNLVDANSLQLMTMKRVKPGSLNESYLWHKLNDTQLEVGGTGLVMPSNIPLSAPEIELFGRWIAAGAPP